MSSAPSLDALRARFDREPNGDLPPEVEPPAASGSAQSGAADVVGPIQIVPPRTVETPPAPAPTSSTASAPSRHGELDTARGILFGVVLGSICWGLIGALLYAILR